MFSSPTTLYTRASPPFCLLTLCYHFRTDFDRLTGDLYAGHTLNMHLTIMRGDPNLPSPFKEEKPEDEDAAAVSPVAGPSTARLKTAATLPPYQEAVAGKKRAAPSTAAAKSVAGTKDKDKAGGSETGGEEAGEDSSSGIPNINEVGKNCYSFHSIVMIRILDVQNRI